MSRLLTKKQRKFADEYIETGNGSRAAKNTYDVTTDESARAVASENLTKPNVIAYLESKAERAASRIVELSEQDEALPVALGASKDILDRAGFKPVDKTQSLNINTTIDIREELKELAHGLLNNQRQ